MLRTLPAALTLAILTSVPHAAADGHDPKAEKIMHQVEAAVGSYDDLLALGDVRYDYVYRDNATFTQDISIEAYIFDGEYSWAEYKTHEKFVFPGKPGNAIQGWDGENAWVLLGGKRVLDPEAVGLAGFLRPTNFYWFAMMQKLNDPGNIHNYKGTQTVNGVTYDKVELTFETPAGKKSDTYLLFVNPDTHRVDRFVFTVVDLGIEDPILMEVNHQRFGDVVLPVTRRYTPAKNWQGDVADDAVWVDEQMTDISFGHGFQPKHFTAEYSAANIK